MKNVITTAFALMLCAFVAFGQKDTPKAPEAKKPTAADLAKLAIAFHGGDKFKNYKTLIIRGSTDVSVSFGGQSQTLTGAFITTFAGDKYRIELITPLQNFSQASDGTNTVSSMPQVAFPPLNRLGLPLLQRFGDTGFEVSELPVVDGKKKTGFRITSPDGYHTDFYVDEKTGEVKGYDSAYTIRDRDVTTAVEIDKLREVDGVKIPEKYSQRFDLGLGQPVYAAFKAKDIIINAPIEDDVFTKAGK